MKVEEKTDIGLDEIEFLVFEFMGSLIGIDSQHISRIVSMEEARKEEADVQWLSEKLSFGGKDAELSDPRVIFIRDGDASKGLVIDRPRDFVKVPLRSIRPLPVLLEKCKGTRPLWGAFVHDGKVVLLADFFKLMENSVES